MTPTIESIQVVGEKRPATYLALARLWWTWYKRTRLALGNVGRKDKKKEKSWPTCLFSTYREWLYVFIRSKWIQRRRVSFTVSYHDRAEISLVVSGTSSFFFPLFFLYCFFPSRLSLSHSVGISILASLFLFVLYISFWLTVYTFWRMLANPLGHIHGWSPYDYVQEGHKLAIGKRFLPFGNILTSCTNHLKRFNSERQYSAIVQSIHTNLMAAFIFDMTCWSFSFGHSCTRNYFHFLTFVPYFTCCWPS